MSDNDNLQEPLFEGLSPAPEPKSTSQGKRKRGAAAAATSALKPVQKSKKQKVMDDEDLDLDLSINRAFSQMNSQLLADYVAQRTRKFESDLSSIELEDRFVSGITILTTELFRTYSFIANSIYDTTVWSKPRTVENLPAFLEKFAKNPTKLWSASKKNGAPHTIIVAGAGMRAADLARYF